MDTKTSLVFVVTLLAHASFWTPCYSYPWSNFFSSSKTSETKTEAETASTAAAAENKTRSGPVTAAVPPASTTATVQKSASTSSNPEKNDPSATPNDKDPKNSCSQTLRPIIRNAGIARAPIGFLARLAKMGTDGLRSIVQGGTDLGSTTIDQATMLHGKIIDGTQNVIERSTQKSLDKLVPVLSQLDTYRRSFSGGTKGDNADKAHSITITTSSDAPINSMYNFAKDFMPAGATGSSALPPITSVDFSRFLR